MTAEQIVQAAWRHEIQSAWLDKTTAEPDRVPCPECCREVSWAASTCTECGVAYDDQMRRYRARIYEGLLWG